MKYKHLVLGGTFDLLHKGHRKFLATAFEKAQKVTIGLTSDTMASQKGNLFQSYKARRDKIIKFLKSEKFKNWKIVKIDDAFGIATGDPTLDVILVSPETVTGAKSVNRLRETASLKPLTIIQLKMIMADDGKKISSGRIKNGEISREGISYYKLLKKNKKYILPEYLRASFSMPLGKLYKSVEEFVKVQNHRSKLYVVGDYSVSMFLKAGFVPDLSIIDFRIQRKNVYKRIEDLGFRKNSKFQTAKNKPGEITNQLSTTIYQNVFGKGNIIKVDGEEDLAVLPVVLLVSLGSSVVYGQRGKGIVLITVTEREKARFVRILGRFLKND